MALASLFRIWQGLGRGLGEALAWPSARSPDAGPEPLARQLVLLAFVGAAGLSLALWLALRADGAAQPVALAGLALIAAAAAWLAFGIARRLGGLAQRLRRAEAADRAKVRFLAAISHDLRTPLNSVIGFAETMELELLGPLGNDRYREYTANISASARQFLRLFEDILELADLDGPSPAVRAEPVALGDLLPALVQEAERGLADRGLTVTAELGARLPGARLDPRALRRRARPLRCAPNICIATIS